MQWMCLLLLMAAAIGVNSQANIDTLEPIYRSFPDNETNNEYFGYSVVLHQLSVPSNRATSLAQTRIIVSAPNATVQGSPVQFTGALYLCPVNQGSCQPFNQFDRLYDTQGNTRTQPMEDKSRQFLGVAMDSRDGNFVVCAHRYVDEDDGGEDRNPYGRCFLTSDRDFQGNFDTFEPCSGRGRDRGNFGYCEAGTSASWARNNDGSYSVGVGAPGSYTYGGVLFRREADGSVQQTDRNQGTSNQLWMGYAMTSGRMATGTNREDFVVSVPRGNTYTGYVNIIRNNDNANVLSQVVVGTQTGEYFGYSLLTADLNGDGLDDLLVGAPMYTVTGKPEVGRVFVYNNVQGSLSEARTLVGNVSYARFGYAMANLGDINSDGFHDVAISAPFGMAGESGTVFIYRGSAQNTLNPNPVQVIVGSVLTGPLSPSILSPSGFGTSLASGVDVDMNGYNDLAIGAWESQQVFLLRTRAVAAATVTFISDSTTVSVENPTCTRNGEMFTCFNVEICVRYTGTNLEGSNIDFSVTLNAESQNVQDGLLARLFFDTNCPPSIPNNQVNTCPNTVELSIDDVPYNVQGCVGERVYVKPNIDDIFNPFLLDMSVAGPEFVAADTSGNPDPSNLEAFPVVQANGPSSLQVAIQNACAGTTCYPDLAITVDQFIYLGLTTGQTQSVRTMPSPTGITGGSVRTITMGLTIANSGDDAFSVRLGITLPRPELTYSRVSSMFGVSCSEESSGMEGEVRACPLVSRLQPGGTLKLNLTLIAERTITEETPDITIGFVVSSANPENDTDLGNNSAQHTFTFIGRADVFLEQPIATPESLTYMNVTPTSIRNVSDLGPPVSVTFAVGNSGPTMANVDLMIYWPLMAGGQEDVAADSQTYYFYPFEFTREASVSVTCTPDPAFNPDGFLMPVEIGDGSSEEEGIVTENKRRRRRRYLAHVATRNQRRKRQEDESSSSSDTTDVQDLTIDCTSSDECYLIPCQILSLPANQTASITIHGYLDERYFAPRADRFTFIVAANVTSNRVQSEDQDRPDMQQVQVRVLPIEPQVAEGDPIPIWVIIVPIILGVLAIVTLGVILYLVGFFKRKHKQKKDEIQAQYLGDPADADAPATAT